jgi:argonaute-like protein implicated in RNA metabolism and viral defense
MKLMKNTLVTLFQSFETGIRSSKAIKPKEYLKNIGLDYAELRIGFNSGQFHHRETQEFKDEFEALGVLKKSFASVRKEDMTAYTVFERYGLIFPLVDKENEIVNYFALRFDLDTPKEEYLNSAGIYPTYPNPLTKRLYIAPTVIDCASLIQSKTLENREAVITLQNGELLYQHLEAIKAFGYAN